MKQWLLDESKLWWFLLLVGATVVIIWLQQTFFISDVLYYNTFGDQLSIDTIEMMIGGAKKYAWTSYIVLPILLLLRVTLTACCFYTALFFRNDKPDFASCFNVSLKADTVFFFFGFLNLIYQVVIPANNLTDLSANPLTLLYYLDTENIPKYLLYPLGLVNVAESFYWALMVGLIHYRFKFSLVGSFYFILKSYGIGLILMALIFSLFVM